MDRSIRKKDLKNVGGFKTRISKKYSTGFDKNTFSKLNTLIDGITDTLFLPLSTGIRIPAMFTGKIYTSGSSWTYENLPYNGMGYIVNVSENKTGDMINYLDITLNPSIISKTDISALYFIDNASDITFGSLEDNKALFPRVSQIIDDNTVRVVVEVLTDTSFGNYEDTGGAVDGLSFFIKGLYQTSAENADRAFYTSGVPYFDLVWVYGDVNTLRPAGHVYTDLDPGAIKTQWPSKIRARARYWTGDCATGYGTGGYFYSDWEDDYDTGLHQGKKIFGLSPLTKYKVWVQIDSKVGADALDWTSVGCYTTKPSGDPGEEYGLG